MPLLLNENAPIEFGLFVLALPFYVGLLVWIALVNIRRGFNRWVALFLAAGLAALGWQRYATYELAEDYNLAFYILPLLIGLLRLAWPTSRQFSDKA